MTIQIPSLIRTILKNLHIPEEMRPSWTLSLGMSSLKKPSYKAVPTQMFPKSIIWSLSFILSPLLLVHCLPVSNRGFLSWLQINCSLLFSSSFVSWQFYLVSEYFIFKNFWKWNSQHWACPLSILTSQSHFHHLLNGINYILSLRINKLFYLKALCILKITVEVLVVVLSITLPVSLQFWNIDYFQITS